MKFLKVAFLLSTVIVLNFSLSLAQGLEITPVRFDFALEPGSNQTETLTVKNTSNKRQIFTMNASDWYMDEEGNVIRQEPGASTRSCAEWLTFTPALVELEPNASQEVSVALNVPGSEMKTKWAVIYVTLQKEQVARQADQELSMGIEVNQSIAIYVTQSPASNTDGAAKLASFEEVENTEGSRAFSVIAENVGDKVLDCKMYMVISDLQNASERRLEPVQFRMLPGSKRKRELSLPEDLKTGSYLVAAILDYGPNYPLEGAQVQVDIE